MTMQQQATQGLFLSPGDEKSHYDSYYHIKLLKKKKKERETERARPRPLKKKKLQLGLPILAHFQKIPRSLQGESLKILKAGRKWREKNIFLLM